MKRIVVIGGGITGLAAAHRLHQKAGASVELQLLEASPRLGGILKTTQRDGFVLESGPDCFLSNKPRGKALCEELGLADQLIPTRTENRRSFIVREGTLIPVPEGFYLIAPSKLRPFLGSPLLSWKSKWRVLAEPLLAAHPQTDETLGSFVRRRLGQETLDWLAQPLLAGIYAADPETLSLKATFPEFLQMEETYGSVLVGLKKRDAAIQEASGARYSLFVTLRNGMQTLTEQLEKHLPGISIRRNTAVKTLGRSSRGWLITLSTGEALEADAVCLALPAYRCGELIRDVAPSLADLLGSIPYSSSATIQFAYRESDIPHPLDGFGFVTPAVEHRATLACTFVHRKFTGRVPGGRALLRAFVGGAMQADLLQETDAQLVARVRKDFKEILGITHDPQFTVVDRWHQAMPQYSLGHIARILQVDEALLGLPRLAMAGNWQRGVGIPDCIESGERAADILLHV